MWLNMRSAISELTYCQKHSFLMFLIDWWVLCQYGPSELRVRRCAVTPVPVFIAIYSIIGGLARKKSSAVTLQVSISKICSRNILFEGVISTKIWNGHDDLRRSVLCLISKVHAIYMTFINMSVNLYYYHSIRGFVDRHVRSRFLLK